MKIRVLGCHGSDQLLAKSQGHHQCRTCGFLVNGTVMVDAGTIGAALHLDEQRRIRHIVLSHLHFDHIQGLPTLADNLVDDSADSVELVGTAQVIGGLRRYLFNDKVYPNFMALPHPKRPIFKTRTFKPGGATEVGGLQVMPIRVNHLVPTMGFLIREGRSSFLYSGDTHETEQIWKVAAREPTLKAVFIETSFPDELSELARVSKHLTPTLLIRAFQKIKRPDVPVYVYHVKPRFRDDIARQLARFRLPNLTVLEEGQEIVI
ncbi:MAG: 3',5'-cyclic-nucleotide phosphodiesterase [Nitrospirota bacterium]|nr:3',5'-cyclic-nucleotide phosphodiesterase [Nitrospirota bacterium]MDE3244085.1 3',5'-cyclic-nucleotide phosphodiesterase [Nitrospirota bacterium]